MSGGSCGDVVCVDSAIFYSRLLFPCCHPNSGLLFFWLVLSRDHRNVRTKCVGQDLIMLFTDTTYRAFRIDDFRSVAWGHPDILGSSICPHLFNFHLHPEQNASEGFSCLMLSINCPFHIMKRVDNFYGNSNASEVATCHRSQFRSLTQEFLQRFSMLNLY